MAAKFEHWVNTMEHTGQGPLAVFFTALSSTGYHPGQVKYLKENADIASKLKISKDALEQAWDSYDGDWDDISALEVRVPE